MGTVVVYSRADANGVLHLDLPLGATAAGQEWKVTIERVPRTMTREEWIDWVDKTAGCITDPSFVRHPQCEHEVRDTV